MTIATEIPDDFEQKNKLGLTIWINQQFPKANIDTNLTFEQFREWAEAGEKNGKPILARIWSSKFKRVIRTGIRERWQGIVAIKVANPALDSDWAEVLATGSRIGMGGRIGPETIEQYRARLERFGKERVPNVANLFK